MMKNNGIESMNALLSAVASTDSILLFSHISPDGDTLGSALALRLLLQQRNKKVTMVLDGDIPENLRFLPGADGYAALDTLTAGPGDLAIAVDVSCEERLGQAASLFHAAGQTAVIDHHGTNDGFGASCWIDPDAPATAILIHRLYQASATPISPEAAVCLYTALATDTGNFVYQSVNAETFTMMASLMDAGLPLADYSRALFRQKRESVVLLVGKAQPSLRVTAEGRVAGLAASLEQFREIGLSPCETDGVVDYAIDIKGVRMAYFAHENENGEIKFSLRSLSPYRIDEVAASLGGGGHQLAAGCTLRMPLQQAVQEMERLLAQAYAAQKAAR